MQVYLKSWTGTVNGVPPVNGGGGGGKYIITSAMLFREIYAMLIPYLQD